MAGVVLADYTLENLAVAYVHDYGTALRMKYVVCFLEEYDIRAEQMPDEQFNTLCARITAAVERKKERDSRGI